jgi:threonine-phosphate decarboxylase
MVLTPSDEHGGNIRLARYRYGIDNIIDFSSNINPLGFPKGFHQALRSGFKEIDCYPETAHHPICETLPRLLGVGRDRILLGNGSTELLYLIPLALKLKRCLVCSPSYFDYERSFRRVGMQIDFFPAEEKDDFRWDLTRLSQEISEHDIVVMGNPNNPTSVYTPSEEILDLIRSYPKIYFLIDEAFIDFLTEPVSLIGAEMPPNLLVLKSLTKFYAIPGLRLGCLVTSHELIDRIGALQEPWTVNCLAAEAGNFLLQQTDHIENTRDFVSREKDYLFQKLTAIPGLKPFHPTVNFILVKITQKTLTSTSLKDKMARKGILIRDCVNFEGLSERYFRVSVNTHKENKLLLAALKETLG